MERRIVNPWTWQDNVGFVQANEVSGAQRTLYCFGVAAIDADGRPVHAGDMAAQIDSSLDNLETLLGAAGMGLADVVRLVYYTTDLGAMHGAWGGLVERLAASNCRPACSLVGVTGLAYPELLVEIEATAVA
jgi:2-iminobutanoate/2-iminopropanoate deaminase